MVILEMLPLFFGQHMHSAYGSHALDGVVHRFCHDVVDDWRRVDRDFDQYMGRRGGAGKRLA